MFPNIKAEMVRRRISQKDLLTSLKERGIKMCYTTLSLKLNGKQGFLFREAVAIKEILRSELPLEVLFAE